MSSYLGILARNNRLCPIYKSDWRLNKGSWKRLFSLFEEKFSYDIPRQEMKRIVLQSIGVKWKSYKSELREDFDPMLSDEENFKKRPADVLPDQWEQLVLLFRRGQSRSDKAKEIRRKLKINHTLGRKSYARKKKELEDKKGGVEVSPLELYKETHMLKGSDNLCGEAAKVEEEARRKVDEKIGQSSVSGFELFALEQEALAETLGPERSGRVRGQGLGVNPTRYYEYCRNQAGNLEVRALKMKLEEMSRHMIEVEAKREQKLKEMEEELAKKSQLEEERDRKMNLMETEMAELKSLLINSKMLKKRGGK